MPLPQQSRITSLTEITAIQNGNPKQMDAKTRDTFQLYGKLFSIIVLISIFHHFGFDFGFSIGFQSFWLQFYFQSNF